VSSGLLQGLVEGVNRAVPPAVRTKLRMSLFEEIEQFCDFLREIGLDVYAFYKALVASVEFLEEELDVGCSPSEVKERISSALVLPPARDDLSVMSCPERDEQDSAIAFFLQILPPSASDRYSFLGVS